MLIDEVDLQRLLESRKAYIGHSMANICGEIISFSGLAVSVSQIESPVLQFVLGAVATCTAWRIHDMTTNRYTTKTLESEIKSLDKIHHRHALIAIKNTFESFPNKYLMYYESTWDCPFLLNYKSTNAGILRGEISNALKIPESDMGISLVGMETYRKFSEETKTDKWYEHSLYYAAIESFPAEYRQIEFKIEGRHFMWLTIGDMKKHPRISKVNMDVVRMIENAHI